MYDDIKHLIGGEGFDAVICLGNSFAHMLDNYGDQREQKLAIKNFERCVKRGGVLVIDHRNYDNIMDTGSTPAKSIYYNVSHVTQRKCVLFMAHIATEKLQRIFQAPLSQSLIYGTSVNSSMKTTHFAHAS